MAEELHRRTITGTDGHAARECLADPRFTALVTPRQVEAARELIRSCALRSANLSELRAVRLTRALRISDEVIRDSVRRPHPQPEGVGEQVEARWVLGVSATPD